MEKLEFTVVKRMIKALIVVLEICCKSFNYMLSSLSSRVILLVVTQ